MHKTEHDVSVLTDNSGLPVDMAMMAVVFEKNSTLEAVTGFKSFRFRSAKIIMISDFFFQVNAVLKLCYRVCKWEERAPNHVRVTN